MYSIINYFNFPKKRFIKMAPFSACKIHDGYDVETQDVKYVVLDVSKTM